MRYHRLDHLRGVNVISMVAYHVTWDLVYLFGMDWKWYQSAGAYVWQQCICWTFILLSGFCYSLGKRHLRRGLEVFGAGVLVSLVTLVAMPEDRVLFGILTLLGSSMLLLWGMEPLLKKISAKGGLVGSAFLFFVFRNVNEGYLGFEGLRLVKLPSALYRNPLTTYLGFPHSGFYSTDYFSLVPWFFLFLCGYFLYRSGENRKLWNCLQGRPLPKLDWIGRNALLIYLLHQPLSYGILSVWFGVF
ncbi:MAG: heparan-alpha-glucosaminide N-acetyltransferase domain-containing protein [bacterium]|nr:heparan-alpha-glucosaminide N-acetyltransferase domain-containing protein [bacterium]